MPSGLEARRTDLRLRSSTLERALLEWPLEAKVIEKGISSSAAMVDFIC